MLSLPAAIIADSGGRTEIHPALHAFWRLDLPATEAGIETVCRIGRALAIRSGGDPVFRQPGQVVRAGLNQIDSDSREGNAALGPTNSSARPVGAGRVNVTVP